MNVCLLADAAGVDAPTPQEFANDLKDQAAGKAKQAVQDKIDKTPEMIAEDQEGAARAPAPAAEQLPAQADTGATVAAGDLKAGDFFPDQPPEISLEQYASLCVERALRPGQEGAVAARYRVMTEAALRQLDEQRRGRFAQQGELYRRFQQVYAQ